MHFACLCVCVRACACVIAHTKVIIAEGADLHEFDMPSIFPSPASSSCQPSLSHFISSPIILSPVNFFFCAFCSSRILFPTHQSAL